MPCFSTSGCFSPITGTVPASTSSQLGDPGGGGEGCGAGGAGGAGGGGGPGGGGVPRTMPQSLWALACSCCRSAFRRHSPADDVTYAAHLASATQAAQHAAGDAFGRCLQSHHRAHHPCLSLRRARGVFTHAISVYARAIAGYKSRARSRVGRARATDL